MIYSLPLKEAPMKKRFTEEQLSGFWRRRGWDEDCRGSIFPRYFSVTIVAKACSRTLSKFGLLAILLAGLPKELHQDASLRNCRVFNNERSELAGFLTVRDTKSRHWSSRHVSEVLITSISFLGLLRMLSLPPATCSSLLRSSGSWNCGAWTRCGLFLRTPNECAAWTSWQKSCPDIPLGTPPNRQVVAWFCNQYEAGLEALLLTLRASGLMAETQFSHRTLTILIMLS
jgi:hypothetical protein